MRAAGWLSAWFLPLALASTAAAQIIPGGQSGVLGSPFYASQLGRWLTNQYKPVNIKVSDAVANPIVTLNFVP